MSQYAPETVKNYEAAIEAEGVKQIPGHPNCETMIAFICDLTHAAKQVECDYSNFGMMFTVLPRQVYMRQSQEKWSTILLTHRRHTTIHPQR